jgi:4-amino-4-deoxy-L-arabinose transferase-like glycosyltransferase
MKFLREWWPEGCLIAIALFFSLRELPTFPASWEDSGLYTMVAQSVAGGHGYALPILDHQWHFPYFISVGPTVILPVSLLIKIFGFNLAIARIPSVLYLLGTSLLFYIYTKKIADRENARWSTALLVSLSAFINTGKPVQGSIAAFFFLLLTLIFLHKEPRRRGTMIAAGFFLGLSILTKLTYVLALPALCIAIAYKYSVTRKIPSGSFICLAIAIAIPAVWIGTTIVAHAGFWEFLTTAFGRSSDGNIITAFLNKIPLAQRFQYQYFALLLALAVVGFRKGSFRMSRFERVLVGSLFALFFVHFLLREGWYRHLLLAHLLLLFFVPSGVLHLLGKKWGSALLAFFVIVQCLWQLDHRGSSKSTAAVEAATYIEHNLADQDVLIQHPEIFVRLQPNPHWLYYPIGGTEELLPKDLTTLSDAQRCMPFIKKLSDKEYALYKDSMILVSGGYYLVPKRLECKQ